MSESKEKSVVALQRALAKLGPGSVTVADVGARWGAATSWFRMKPLAKLIGFEPDPVECQRLNESANQTQERLFPVALGNHDGPATLYVTREPACSSLFPPSQFMLARYQQLRDLMEVERTVPVQLSRMASWAAQAGIEQVDFIKLDTQGSELDILTGADSLLDRCIGIEAELMFSPLYEGQPLFSDVDQFLRSRGFTLWRIESLAHYSERPSGRLTGESDVHYDLKLVRHGSGDGRLRWANVIYFRDREQFRDSERDLLVLAALLEAAGDIDGSESCLREADRFSNPESLTNQFPLSPPGSSEASIPWVPIRLLRLMRYLFRRPQKQSA